MKILILLTGTLLSTFSFAQSRQDDQDVMNRPDSRLAFDERDRYHHLSGGNALAPVAICDAGTTRDGSIPYRGAQFLEDRALTGLQYKDPECYAMVLKMSKVHLVPETDFYMEFGPYAPSVRFENDQLIINQQVFYGGSISAIDQLIGACHSQE